MRHFLITCITIGLSYVVQAQLYHQETQGNLYYSGLQTPDHLMFSPNLAVYYPQELESTAEVVREMTGVILQEFEQMLDYRLNGRIEIWLSEGRTGMGGSQVPEQPIARKFPTNSGGISSVDHKRIRLMYKGAETELYLDLRKSLAGVMVKELLYGVSVAEKARNTAYLQFPTWFTEGLQLYLSDGWTSEDDHYLRDQLMDRQKATTLLRYGVQAPAILKSNWHYLIESRGTGILARMVYLSKLTRSIESALYFVMNMSYTEFVHDAQIWHLQRYLSEKKAGMPGRLIALPRELKQAKIADMMLENGQTWVSHVQQYGISIWRYNTESGWKKVHFERGAREARFIQDPVKKSVYLLLLDHHGYRIRSLNTSANFERWNQFLGRFSQIRDLVFNSEGDLWCSGYKGEQFSDIYRLDASGNEFRLTRNQDAETELVLSSDQQLFWINVLLGDSKQGKSALKYSIRTLKNDSIHIIYETHGDKLNNLLVHPMLSGLSFCSDMSGIMNAYGLDSLSGKPFALTDYSRNITFQSEGGMEVAELLQYRSEWVLSVSEYAEKSAEITKVYPTLTTWKRHQDERLLHGKPSRFPLPGFPEPLQRPEELPFYFQTDIPLAPDVITDKRQIQEKQTYGLTKPLHFPALAIQEVYTRFDNGLMGISRQNPLMNPRLSLRYGIGILGGGLWSDISGQRRLLLAMRVQTQLNGSDEFIQYDTRKRKQTQGFSLYRSSFRNGAFLQGYERFSTLQWSAFHFYGLRDHSRIELKLLARNDRRIKLITDEEHLEQFEPTNNYAFLGTLQFHHLRNTVSGELLHLLQIRTETGWAQSPTQNGHVLEGYLLGVKQMFGSHSTRVLFRVHAASSFGMMKTIFVSGGVANWVNQQYRSNLILLKEDAFSVSGVPHLRAVPQNARNGNSHFSLQTEADWKILGLIFQRPLLQPLWREFRLGVFSDFGTAWYGAGPYDKKNPLFITQIQAPGLDIELYQRRNPFLWSNGFQLSFPLYGYQIHYHAGRALEDSQLKPWIHSLSIGFEW